MWLNMEFLQSKLLLKYSIPDGIQEPMQRLFSGHSFSVWGRLEEGFKSRFGP